MTKITTYLLVISSLFFGFVSAQTKMLHGTVVTNQNVENIHVTNISLHKSTITNHQGNFSIPVRLKDTLEFSSVQHQTQTVLISQKIYSNAYVVVPLETVIQELNEVVVGNILTGNIKWDVLSEKNEPMTALKAGIPSFQGKPLTMPQRYLKDAGDLNPRLGGSLGGLGASVRLIPVINAITGRTKKMKHYVNLEQRELLLDYLTTAVSKTFFQKQAIPKNKEREFLIYLSEQTDFLDRCSAKNDVEIYEYMREKFQIYSRNANLPTN
ncbi:hypothetical protein ACFSQP_08645 [Bizionia sediminis]|uniref:Carboxypeptidase-like regulatory domain-containing protein n=1 Tax=Bizionia sediminis TaxID=1737064 RepID=A0ABW5KSA4_9FLAO